MNAYPQDEETVIDPPPAIWRAAPHIRDGDLRSTDLVRTCLDRTDQYESLVRAWVLVDRRGARAAAEQADRAVRAGRYLGPLHGVPIGIKDIIDVAGLPTRAGSTLTDATPATQDAPVVARLRAAGAVILGKTVTTEFAGFDPSATRNPWNFTHTPGGSSSGSAAAVAAGMCAAAVGSQTGGSLIRPASYCGVASCKPTFGRIGTAGVVPVSPLLDHVGPIARCVADLAYLLAVMVPDPRLLGHFAGALRTAAPPRLGLLEAYFMEGAEQAVALATRDALRRLDNAGAAIVARPLPEGFAEVHAMHRCIMAVDTAAFHKQCFAKHQDRYGTHLASTITEGLATPTAAYRAARAHQRRFRHAAAMALDGVDALVTPATPTSAPPRDSGTGDPRFNTPWSYCGLPAVSFPCGVTANGLPLALQLIGRPDGEAELLAAAAWCERQIGLHLTPTGLTNPSRVEGSMPSPGGTR